MKHKCSLAGPVGSEERYGSARLQFKVDSLQRVRTVLISEVQILYFDYGFHRNITWIPTVRNVVPATRPASATRIRPVSNRGSVPLNPRASIAL